MTTALQGLTALVASGRMAKAYPSDVLDAISSLAEESPFEAYVYSRFYDEVLTKGDRGAFEVAKATAMDSVESRRRNVARSLGLTDEAVSLAYAARDVGSTYDADALEMRYFTR